MNIRAGIVGITGYTGVELHRILASHPSVRVTWTAAGQSAGQAVADSWRGLQGLVDLPVERFDPAVAAERCDVVFLGMPHGHAARSAPDLLERGLLVVDLGADFRFRDALTYEQAYGATHPSPSLLSEAVYGLPELFRDRLVGARLIANPGCYPTAVALAAAPLVRAGLGGEWLVADCLSGVSGAGRSASARNLYCETTDSARAYGLSGSHRHAPEIEQTLGLPVTFTPHLVPMNRGMVATVHARPPRPVAKDELRAIYETAYGSEPMVVLRDDPPGSADARGSNRAHVHVSVDERRGVVTIVSVIDNLVKGASGQAVQAMNVALGLPEAEGLPLYPLLP